MKHTVYTIIEDCSPYYIRFKHQNIDRIVDYCSDKNYYYSEIQGPDSGRTISEQSFINYKIVSREQQDLLDLIPMRDILPISQSSLFIAGPGTYYRAHKDGLGLNFGINYSISILDDKCVTSWYSDNDLAKYSIDTLGNRSRECTDFVKEEHTPLKSMTAVQGECTLFNTKIFHDFDNTQSSNIRVILALRFAASNLRFAGARKILFGY
jgi:hypothetical protein